MSACMVSSWLYEKRPLKRAKLGPPDFYPQDPKQKEDELTAVNVKQGFSNNSSITEEYGSARNTNITPNKFGSYFSALLAKKLEINTLPECSRKRQQINVKDNIWFVTSKSKNAVDQWFKDLASNTKTLSQLSRKVPIFNKKEEIFSSLYEFKIPLFKAQWFIKMSAAHHLAISESNNKKSKRQMPDQSQEWTNALCKFLREQYQKMCEYYHGVPPTTTNTASAPLPVSLTSDEIPKQWQYYTQLTKHMFDDGLLDKHDFLSWLLDLLEKIKTPDDTVIAIVNPLIIQYVDEFTQSEHLSRKLAYQCAKKLNQLVTDYNLGQTLDVNVDTNANVSGDDLKNTGDKSGNNITNNSVIGSNANTNTNNNATANGPNSIQTVGTTDQNQSSSAQLISCFNELTDCSHHRNVILGLSVILQIITLDCPTALVWLNLGETKTALSLQGSPLDYLPCEPSNLPMPTRSHNQYLRNELQIAEEQIRQRSKMSEMRWFCDRWQQTAGTTVNKLLTVLDSLDRHCFDKLDANNSMDTLFSKIFTPFNNSNATNAPITGNSPTNNATTTSETTTRNVTEVLAEDESIVKLLCEWAVTTKRTGEHRALVVAKLLEKRQTELMMEKESENIEEMDVESTPNVKSETNTDSTSESPTKSTNKTNNTSLTDSQLSTPVFENILLHFLDTQSPVYEDKIGLNSSDNKQAFSNLILLFGELIRRDVFSHDLYMCTLISRGQFSNSPNTPLVTHNSNTSKSSTLEEPSSLAGFVPNLSANTDLSNHNHLGGLVANGIQKSTSSSSLPMFDPLSNNSNAGQSDFNMTSMDVDDNNLDEDLDKLLQHIKAGQQNMSDQADLLLPDSVESDKEDDPTATGGLGTHSTTFPMPDMPAKNATNRHLLYTMHFPLPQDETFAHDVNQRHVLLYGVGKAKDEAKHAVKKITKEITKLFNRKSSMDISDGGKVKKHAIKEGFNFESAINKFQSLSTFDQHVVTNSCATAAVEMLNGVAIGSANYLPLIEAIAFLFDLMEMALNVYGLIEFVIQMLKELVEVDIQLHQKCPILERTYCTSIGLYIVGVLYRYQSCLLVSHEETLAVFEGLWQLVRHVKNPSDCSSAERCILFYLCDLHSSYYHLRLNKHHDSNSFATMLSEIKKMNNNGPQLREHPESSRTAGTAGQSTSIMAEYLKNPKLKVESSHIRNLNDNTSDRYSFVCSAIQCISMANDIDKLNEMSVLCAELTASCSHLSTEWLCVLKALCCSSNPKSYSELLSHVEVSDLSIHDNLAVFTSILIARRCFSLKDFILQVAVPSLLAPSSTEAPEDAEPGARLTCHLLLCLFKTSETPLSSNTMTSFATSSRYSLTSPGPLVLAQTPPNPSQKPHYNIKYPCDRYLLAAAHSSLRIEIVITVLKAILVLGNSAEKRNTEALKAKGDAKGEISITDILGRIDGEEELGDFGIMNPLSSKTGIMEKAGLSEAAKYALRQICGQQWVHDRCLRGFMIDPEILNKLLLDPKLTHKEAQHLLNMICHPKLIAMHSLQEMDSDQKISIAKILQNLDEWSIRVSWLQLQLMYAQSQNEVNTWLENVAKATVDYFQNSSEEMAKYPHNISQLTLFSPKSGPKQAFYKQSNRMSDSHNQRDRVWLIAPLISKLPTTVEGKILKVAANVLESGNWMTNATNQSFQGSSYSSKNKDRSFQQQKNSSNNSCNSSPPSLLSHSPFLSLLLMCLKGQDDQRESLLNSLYNQISQTINDKLCDDLKAKHSIQEGLQLRLSLVGGMFDMIRRSTSLINDWAVLLMQLISFTIIDPQINNEVFTTVTDMLTILMHTTQVSDSSEAREETKKHYQNLIKKLKKELNIDRITLGIKMVRQLLPITKQNCEVIICEPMGSLIDTKGNKIAGFDSIDKKQGLQVADKQKVSPWDLMEGHKNPSPLSWTWFGAIRIERKPLRGEENIYLMARHSHTIRKPLSFYLEPPPIPPEDVEPIPTPTVAPIPNERIPIPHQMPHQIPHQMSHQMPHQMPPQMMPNTIPNQIMPNIPMDDPMRRTDMIMDIGPRAPTPKKVKNPRRRRNAKNANGNSGAQTPPIRMASGGYGEPQYAPPPPPPQQTHQNGPPMQQNWYGSHPQQTQPAAPPPPQQQQQQMPSQTQQQYFSQQQMVSAQRFQDPVRPVGHSKGALKAMLSTRHPQQQFNAGPNMQSMNQPMINQNVGQQPIYQQRQPVMSIRAQMRGPSAPQMQQLNSSQNQIYQMQSQPNQMPNQSQPMHHMSVQQQNSYGGPPNMSFPNQIPMQAMEQTGGPMTGGPQGGHPPPSYQHPNQHTPQNAMMMRPQMVSQPQQMVNQQTNQQFMAQRSQYQTMQAAPNVTMGQMSQPNQFNQNNSMQQMVSNTGGPHMNQWQTSGQRPQQMVSQLQRQLSGNNQQHNTYHQNQY
ncbi:mediator of RNA polymerase II transcription subunit 12-like protein isoform X2 [Oppia nitens]|uniref:mediator of RNA polymerase II transcription subunit 12-like protein isoform X2 n=1 Tax=Oppia nitens TaxID=1686743 RepID=UPI0023DB896C|nr:mediator of RNA polymerase II transcription subunit 12-like protein isoform X2 [Oppia nitens]